MIKYKKIVNDLISQFNSGKYAPNSKIPTEKELTDIYKVSRVTIRNALDVLVKRGIIYKVAGKGTFYNGAPTYSAKKNIVVAIVIINANAEIIKIVEGINDSISSANIKTNTYISNGLSEKDVCEKVINDGADGIIIFPSEQTKDADYFAKLVNSNYPIVFLDRSPVRNCNIVKSNSELGMYKMTQYLISCGHRNIAYISSFGISVLKERYYGFVQALNEHGIKTDRDNLITLSRTPESISDNPKAIYDGVEKLLKNDSIPTAIVCANDIIALHVLTKLRSYNQKIPEISVTGFDNAVYSSRNAYSITTVEQNFFKIGREAAKMLLDVIQNGNQNITTLLIPVKLICRDSVKTI